MRFVSAFAPSLRTIAATAALVGLACLAPSTAHAQTNVDFFNLGTFTTTAPLTNGGITVTSPGTLGVSDGGLGVVGGSDLSGYPTTDNGETVLFTFDSGPVTEVLVNTGVIFNVAPSTPSTVEVFGVGNTSLGVFNFQFVSVASLSNLVNGSGISAFRLTAGTSQGFSIARVTFTPAAVTPGAVPEPSEWLAMGMATASVGGLMVRARSRRRKNGKAEPSPIRG